MLKVTHKKATIHDDNVMWKLWGDRLEFFLDFGFWILDFGEVAPVKGRHPNEKNMTMGVSPNFTESRRESLLLPGVG